MIDIEKLEDLPKRMGSRRAVKTTESWYRDGLGKSDYHKVNNYFPWTNVTRVLTNYYKKHVNEAFAHYCTLVPFYQQKFFWERFDLSRRYRFITWYLDENGFIQNADFENPEKGPYTLKSPDFKSRLRHRETGHWVEDFYAIREKPYGPILYYTYKGRFRQIAAHNVYVATLEDFVEVTIAGWRKSFSSKRDPGYQKAYQEQQRALRKERRSQAKAKAEIEYCMLTKVEKEIKRLSQFDVVKRDCHGFDEESFKGEFYHGQKRKLKDA